MPQYQFIRLTSLDIRGDDAHEYVAELGGGGSCRSSMMQTYVMLAPRFDATSLVLNRFVLPDAYGGSFAVRDQHANTRRNDYQRVDGV